MTGLAISEVGEVGERVLKDIAFVMAIKADMVRKQLLWDVRAGCPRCAGVVQIALVGHQQHVRAACDTPDCLSVME